MCVGQAIAIVAAETEAQARAAAKAVQVQYEDLPAVLDIEDAIAGLTAAAASGLAWLVLLLHSVLWLFWLPWLPSAGAGVSTGWLAAKCVVSMVLFAIPCPLRRRLQPAATRRGGGTASTAGTWRAPLPAGRSSACWREKQRWGARCAGGRQGGHTGAAAGCLRWVGWRGGCLPGWVHESPCLLRLQIYCCITFCVPAHAFPACLPSLPCLPCRSTFTWSPTHPSSSQERTTSTSPTQAPRWEVLHFSGRCISQGVAF